MANIDNPIADVPTFSLSHSLAVQFVEKYDIRPPRVHCVNFKPIEQSVLDDEIGLVLPDYDKPLLRAYINFAKLDIIEEQTFLHQVNMQLVLDEPVVLDDSGAPDDFSFQGFAEMSPSNLLSCCVSIRIIPQTAPTISVIRARDQLHTYNDLLSGLMTAKAILNSQLAKLTIAQLAAAQNKFDRRWYVFMIASTCYRLSLDQLTK